MPKSMFDPSDRFRTDPFARHHAALRASEARTARAQAEGQTTAQRQQRIQDAAAKRAALARPDPRYKPDFSGASFN
jgi:hypothetical protein